MPDNALAPPSATARQHGEQERKQRRASLNIFIARGAGWLHGDSRQSGQVESFCRLAHFGGGDFFSLAQGLVCSRQDHVFEQLSVGGVDRLRVDVDGGNGAVAPGDDLDGAAAAGGFDGALSKLALDLLHLLLHSRSLFHEFAETGHGVEEVK